MLASKVSRPFSVIHTTSLANINHQYSPEKKADRPATRVISDVPNCKVRPKGSQASSRGPGLNSRGQGSGENRRRSGRHSGQNQMKVKPEKPESVDPEYDVLINVEPKENKSSVGERKEQIGLQTKEESVIPRKKMRRSNTYSNVSGVGLVVPIIDNEEVRGHKDTSLLNIDDCNISGINVIAETSIDNNGPVLTANEPPSFMETSTTKKAENTLEPSFMVEAKILESKTVPLCEFGKTVAKSQGHNEMVNDNLEPSFLSVNKELADVKDREVLHDSLDAMENDENTQPPEQPSFLAPEGEPSKPRRSLRKRSGQFTSKDVKTAGLKLLHGAKRNNSKRLSTEKQGLKKSDRKRSVEGAQQSPILVQLKNLRTFIHDKSLEIENSGSESSPEEKENFTERQETFVKCDASPRFSMPAAFDNIRRGTFVADSAKMKLLETQKPSEASPRRTTFTVMKSGKGKPQKLPTESQLGIDALTEEEERCETSNGDGDLSVDVSKHNQEIGNVRQLDLPPQQSTQRLFSADSLEDENNASEEKFGSPQELLHVSPKENFTRRATLTVTKSRPSDALIENHMQKHQHVTTALFGGLKKSECANDSLNKTDECRSSQNSTFEVSAERSFLVKEAGFQATPHHLPSSPQLDNSRRSTHVVAKPKVVNLSNIDGKQLFPVGHADTSENPVDDKSVGDRACDENENKPVQNIEAATNSDMFSPPSANTRRRTLSAKRKVKICPRDSATENPQKAVTQDMGEVMQMKAEAQQFKDGSHEQGEQKQTVPEQLFFIPLDKVSEQKSSAEPVRKPVARPDPKLFLKKRSSSQAQEVDTRSKRIRSDSSVLTVAKPSDTTRTVTRQNISSAGN